MKKINKSICFNIIVLICLVIINIFFQRQFDIQSIIVAYLIIIFSLTLIVLFITALLQCDEKLDNNVESKEKSCKLCKKTLDNRIKSCYVFGVLFFIMFFVGITINDAKVMDVSGILLLLDVGILVYLKNID